MDLQTGQIIEGKYRIVRLIGQGGMGSVYEGENTRIHRRVAIKVLHASVATKADIVQRFEREAQAAGRIGSEHIVEVLDLGSLPDGARFMVMEFLDGEPLGDRIKARGRIPTLEVAGILRQLLEGLGAAHDAGIVHRDLKPDNVFLLRSKGGQRDFVKLVDFGVSKFSAFESDFSMTRTGAVMGTPFYMSPEQARGQKIDHRSDLYAVGVVAYQMITGRVPFNADTFNELLFKIALESPEPAELLAPGLDPNFSAVVMRGMAREAGARFQTAAEFKGAIDGWMMHQGSQAFAQQGGGMGARQSQGGYGLGQSGGSWANASGTGMPAASPGMGQQQFGNTPDPPYPQVLTHTPQRGVPQAQVQGHGTVPGPPPGQQFPMGQQHPMGQSQVALAVTTGQPSRSGAVIAAIAGMLILGAGGGLVAFKYAGKKPTTTETRSAGDAATDKPNEKPADAAKADPPKTTETSDPAKSAEAKADPPKQDPPVDSASTPVADHSKEAEGQGKAPVKLSGKQAPPPAKTNDPKPPPTSQPTSGRKIDGSL